MIDASILSYAFSHHLFHQAWQLSTRTRCFKAISTSFFAKSDCDRIEKVMPRLASVLKKRSHTRLESQFVKTYPTEHLFQAYAKVRNRPYSYFQAHNRMATRIVKDFNPPNLLIAIDTGAQNLFEAWKDSTICVLDLTIGTPQFRKHIYESLANDPDHAEIQLHMPGDWELDRYAAELELADYILCPSDFVMRSCLHCGVSAHKLRLLPYGFEPGKFFYAERKPSTTFRLAFAGTISFRKGVHVLLKAFERFHARYDNCELHLFGSVIDNIDLNKNAVFMHGRVAQDILAEELRSMDAFVFPSLFEGSAYVVYQALASGLPAIVSKNSGSVVTDDAGIILNEVNVETVLDAICELFHNKEKRQRLSLQATHLAEQYSWETYGDRLQTILIDVLSEKP